MKRWDDVVAEVLPAQKLEVGAELNEVAPMPVRFSGSDLRESTFTSFPYPCPEMSLFLANFSRALVSGYKLNRFSCLEIGYPFKKTETASISFSVRPITQTALPVPGKGIPGSKTSRSETCLTQSIPTSPHCRPKST